jgi:hypothetical protein
MPAISERNRQGLDVWAKLRPGNPSHLWATIHEEVVPMEAKGCGSSPVNTQKLDELMAQYGIELSDDWASDELKGQLSAALEAPPVVHDPTTESVADKLVKLAPSFKTAVAGRMGEDVADFAGDQDDIARLAFILAAKTESDFLSAFVQDTFSVGGTEGPNSADYMRAETESWLRAQRNTNEEPSERALADGDFVGDDTLWNANSQDFLDVADGEVDLDGETPKAS